jgi:hypothetical protein
VIYTDLNTDPTIKSKEVKCTSKQTKTTRNHNDKEPYQDKKEGGGVASLREPMRAPNNTQNFRFNRRVTRTQTTSFQALKYLALIKF